MRYVCLLIIWALFFEFMILKSEVFYTSFENGIDGWDIIGNKEYVIIDSAVSNTNTKSLKITKNKSGIQKKVNVVPLAITDFSVISKCIKSNNSKIKLKIEFYDSTNNLINIYEQTVNEVNWTSKLNSTITPPNVKYAIYKVIFESDFLNDTAYIDDVLVSTNNLQVFNKPTCNLDEYTRPFLSTDTVFDETIMMYSVNGKLATGKLLFSPNKIISIKDYNNNLYFENIDYKLNDNEITVLKDSRIPFRTDTSYQSDIVWYNNYTNGKILAPQWIYITYTHERNWNGIINKSKINLLPKTVEKLKNKSKINIVALGMSITKGMNVSSVMNFPPYMPSYFDLFEDYLKKYYQNTNIFSYNVSMPGSQINDFGLNCIDKYIKPLKPDLLIIEFGMNDFWNIKPELFKQTILQIIDSIKDINNDAEFILVSNMMYDPVYFKDTNDIKVKEYNYNIKGYQKMLLSLEKIGVVNTDVNSLSDSLYAKKFPKDMLSNPVHPNDYMARWYAQSLISALVPIMSGSINKVVNRSNQMVLDNLESKVAQSNVGTNEIIISNKQDWEFKRLENGNNRILSNHSKLALAYENGEIIQSIIKDTTSQEWELIHFDKQSYKLKNKYSQKYLSMDTINNRLLLENENNSSTQQWNIFESYKKEELSINKDTTQIEFNPDSSKFLQIESNTKWTVTTTANWIHFDKNEGNGNKSLKLIIDENVEKSQRTSVINIGTNGLQKRHFIIQSGFKTSINNSYNEKLSFRIKSPTANNPYLYLFCNDSNSTDINISIYDLSGKIIFQNEYNNSQELSIDTSGYLSGLYVLKINCGTYTQLQRLFILK